MLKKNLVALFLAALFVGSAFGQKQIEWREIEAGLEYANFQIDKASPAGDRKLNLLRIDPKQYEFSLMAAANLDRKARTADQWVEEFELTAVVNAGMFQMDGLSNVGYFKLGDQLNNPNFNKDNTLLAFEPTEDELPLFKLIDRECDPWKDLVKKYQFVCQGIRMIDCKQNNKWGQQPRIWSMVIFGMDKSGNAIMAFCRSPYSVHDFIDILLATDLDLYNAMYLEGGPEASMCLRTTDVNLDLFGSYETDFFESDKNNRYWPIPNVIGIKPRQLAADCSPLKPNK